MPGGIVRQIDDLDRVVIPVEVRRTFGIAPGTPLQVFLDGEKIVLHVYRPGCFFCGSGDDAWEFAGRRVCRGCTASLGRLYGGVTASVGGAPATQIGVRGQPAVSGGLDVSPDERVAAHLRGLGWTVEERG